jgi:MATE family multidrug resistance protein
MKPFAVASVIGFIANIPLNYAFIYGKWGAPELGAAGCGWATAISMWLGPVLIASYMLRSKDLKPYLPPLRPVPPHWARLAEIARLGLPIGLTFFIEFAVFSTAALMIATLGNTAISAHQIAFNVWDVVYIPLISVGSAMATRVGHAIGAHDELAVKNAVATGMVITAFVAVICSAALLANPDLIVRAYTTDQTIMALAVVLIRLAALFIIFDAVQIAASFVLRAFKDTRFPFLATCLAYWLISLPLGYWLGLVVADNDTDGTVAFWQTMILGIAIAGVLVSWRLYYRLQQPLPVLQPDELETNEYY